MPPRRLIVHPPRVPSVSQASSGLTTPPTPLGMQLRSAAMAGKEDPRKRGASEVGEGTGAQKKQKLGKGTAAEEQRAFQEEFGEDFEQIEQPVQDKKQKKKKKKDKDGEGKGKEDDETLGILPASQKIPLDKPSKKSQKMTKVEAQGVMHKMSAAITDRTLDDTLRELNALPEDAVSSADGSIVATIPLGYLVEPPVEMGGVMVQPNSRAPSREGIDRIKTHFKANGYLKEAAVMIGVLSVS